MLKLQKKIWKFLLSEDGPTAIEYAVMLALIVVVCMVTIGILGGATADRFEQIATSDALSGAGP